jgi:hypothetical protein
VWCTVSFTGGRNDGPQVRRSSSAPHAARDTTPGLTTPAVVVAAAEAAGAAFAAAVAARSIWPSVVLIATDRAPLTPSGMRTW